MEVVAMIPLRSVAQIGVVNRDISAAIAKMKGVLDPARVARTATTNMIEILRSAKTATLHV